jgi:hypothetical protein
MRLVTLLITVVALAVAAPAIADKGGNPNGGNGGGGGNDATQTPTATATPTPTPDVTSPTETGNGKNSASPSITIGSVDGTRMAASSEPQPAHGTTVTFDTTSGKLGGSHPMVELSCYQDLNGDGTVDTDLFGPDLMVLQLDHPDATFSMSGQVWTAGDATCHARLLAYGWKGGQQSIELLASTYDWTAVW